MVLALDAGNSRIKFGVFDNGQLLTTGHFSYEKAIESLLQLIYKYQIKTSILSSVKKKKWNAQLSKKLNIGIIEVNCQSPFSFMVHYETPETLGIDRLVACEGAISLNNDEGNVLVIDAGTCLTYDYVDQDLNYQGGIISPGLQIRAQGMHNYTDNLPLVNLETKPPQLLGKTTQTCIQSGILNGVTAEAKGIIKEIEGKHQGVKIFLTGGDLNFFENGLKSGIFAEPNLNLVGLARLAKTE